MNRGLVGLCASTFCRRGRTEVEGRLEEVVEGRRVEGRLEGGPQGIYSRRGRRVEDRLEEVVEGKRVEGRLEEVVEGRSSRRSSCLCSLFQREAAWPPSSKHSSLWLSLHSSPWWLQNPSTSSLKQRTKAATPTTTPTLPHLPQPTLHPPTLPHLLQPTLHPPTLRHRLRPTPSELDAPSIALHAHSPTRPLFIGNLFSLILHNLFQD